MIVLTPKEERAWDRALTVVLKKPFGMSVLDFAVEQGWIKRTEPSTAAGASVTGYVAKKRRRR